VFYRDVPPGHYDITIPNRFGSNGSAHFDLAAGQQAFVKLVFWTAAMKSGSSRASPPCSSPNKLRKLSSRT
jgi:hypothetical protein